MQSRTPSHAQILRALNDVIDNIEADKMKALSQFDPLQAITPGEFTRVFHSIVQHRLAQHGVTIGSILRDSQASQMFTNIRELKPVAEFHEKLKQNIAHSMKAEKPTPQHHKSPHQQYHAEHDPILIAANKTFNKREQFWNIASDLAGKVDQHHFEAAREIFFYKIAQSYLQSKGVTFEEVTNHPKAKPFFSSGRLLRAAQLHVKFADIDSQQKQQPAPDSSREKKDALQQARFFADKAGLLTQAGIQEYSDLDDLKRQVKKLQIQHHPDRQQGANPASNDIGKAANAIADLLKRDVFKDYLRAIEHHRKPGAEPK